MKKLSQKTILTSIGSELSEIKGVLGIIVYGSIAKGNYTKASDVDIFVLISEKSYYTKVNDALAGIRSKRLIQPVIRTIDELEKSDATLLKNVFKDGQIIYWNSTNGINVEKILKLSAKAMYSFTLQGLMQKTKTRFNYELYGKRGSGGVLKDYDGRRVGRSGIYFPSKHSINVETLFKKYHIKYEKCDIWI